MGSFRTPVLAAGVVTLPDVRGGVQQAGVGLCEGVVGRDRPTVGAVQVEPCEDPPVEKPPGFVVARAVEVTRTGEEFQRGVHYRRLLEPGVEIRLHPTVLYNSIYRADAEMLVNQHVYGISAAYAPVLHLRDQGDDEVFTTYMESFDRVWSSARPLPA